MGLVVIMRGPAGSGKTHYVRERFPEAFVCSADSFFLQAEEYVFQPEKLPQAHSSCLAAVLTGLRNGHPEIVVDNTHIHNWEWVNYRSVAQLCGYVVRIVEIVPLTLDELRQIVARCVHRVPAEIIARQAMEFETAPGAERLRPIFLG